MAQAQTLPSGQPESSNEVRRVLIIGGGLAGLAAARELRSCFRVTVVDAKEYFEFTSGIMRGYCQPSHWDSLVFPYHEVLERQLGVGFIWGEVLSLDPSTRCVHTKTMFAEEEDVVPYDYVIVAGGCSFNPFSPTGESPWYPTVHQQDRLVSEMRHLDERFLEGRRRRILEEHHSLTQLNERQAKVLIVGAGFMGVEWACELRHYFPGLSITLTDFLPQCLYPLPDDASAYCEEYMQSRDIKTVYGTKYDKESSAYWEKVGLPGGADKTYIVAGPKSSNYFMPKPVLNDKGPGGGGWVMINKHLQVVTRQGVLWGDGRIFAVGDCVAHAIPDPSAKAKASSEEKPPWEIPPVPKTGYSAEQQAVHAARNLRALDAQWHGGAHHRLCCCLPMPTSLKATWYPWGSGIYAISLGPHDGCMVVGSKEKAGSGRMWLRGLAAAAQKELIETTKMAQCRGDHYLARFLWFSVHHWPINLCGRGPLLSL